MTPETIKKANDLQYAINSLKSFLKAIPAAYYISLDVSISRGESIKLKSLGEDNMQVLKNSIEDLVKERLEELEHEFKKL